MLCFQKDHSMEANVGTAFRPGADDPVLLDDQDPVPFIQNPGRRDNQSGSTASSLPKSTSESLVEDDPSIDVSGYLSPTFHTEQSSPSQQI